MDFSEVSNIELAIAVVKCIDSGGGGECHGCPLEGETSCGYYLKIEVMKRLLKGDGNAEQDH